MKRGDRGVAGRGGADGTGINIDKAKKTTQTGTRGRARRRVDQSEEMVWTSTIRRVIIRHECHARQREGKQYEVSCINRDERRKEKCPLHLWARVGSMVTSPTWYVPEYTATTLVLSRGEGADLVQIRAVGFCEDVLADGDPVLELRAVALLRRTALFDE